MRGTRRWRVWHAVSVWDLRRFLAAGFHSRDNRFADRLEAGAGPAGTLATWCVVQAELARGEPVEKVGPTDLVSLAVNINGRGQVGRETEADWPTARAASRSRKTLRGVAKRENPAPGGVVVSRCRGRASAPVRRTRQRSTRRLDHRSHAPMCPGSTSQVSPALA